MKYLSVCSGIEAASVAWAPLGWQPVGFSEIDLFASQVLAHRFGSNMPGERWSHNAPPNFGDMTKFKEWPDAVFDVLVGGTPCQSFSVAGLRQGLADPRGNLMLTYLAILDRYRPEWFLWENVPGVLSSNEGRDFGAFLGGLGQLGYGFAYRVLDAQFIRIDGFGWAVPQRRRRVFVVGHIDWRRAAAVLFDAASLYGDPPPRRQARQGVAGSISASAGRRGGVGTDPASDGTLISMAHGQANAEIRVDGGAPALTCIHEAPIVARGFQITGNDGAYENGDKAGALTTGTDRTSQVIAFSAKDHGGDAADNVSPTLRAGGFTGSHANAGVMPAVAFDMRGRDGGAQLEGPHETANIRAASGGSSRSYIASAVCPTLRAGGNNTGGDRPPGTDVDTADSLIPVSSWAVRRLMPIECERLQGFPDNWTQVPVRGKPAADGPRYKTLGNSMAVNVIRWIGHRIDMVRAIP